MGTCRPTQQHYCQVPQLQRVPFTLHRGVRSTAPAGLLSRNLCQGPQGIKQSQQAPSWVSGKRVSGTEGFLGDFCHTLAPSSGCFLPSACGWMFQSSFLFSTPSSTPQPVLLNCAWGLRTDGIRFLLGSEVSSGEILGWVLDSSQGPTSLPETDFWAGVPGRVPVCHSPGWGAGHVTPTQPARVELG